MPLSPGLFWVVLFFAAGALALWLDVRFPRLGEGGTQKLFLHAAASFIVVTSVVPAVVRVVLAPETLVAVETAAIAVVLPGFTYALLSCLWLLKLGRRAITGDLP